MSCSCIRINNVETTFLFLIRPVKRRIRMGPLSFAFIRNFVLFRPVKKRDGGEKRNRGLLIRSLTKTHRETRRLMLFSHLSAKNPSRHHVVLSISAIPRAGHKANIIAPSILSMEFIYLTSNRYCVTVGKKYSYVKTVFFVNTTINLRNIDLSSYTNLRERSDKMD